MTGAPAENGDKGYSAFRATDADWVLNAPGVGRFLRFARFLNAIGLYVSSAIVLSMMVLICVELVLRNLFSVSLLFVDEVVGQLVGGFAFFGVGYALQERALIRVEVLYARLSPKRKAFVEIVYDLFSLLYMGILTYFLVRLIDSSIRHGVVSVSRLETPIWIPQLLMPIGAVILVVSIIAQVVRQVVRLRSGRLSDQSPQ